MKWCDVERKLCNLKQKWRDLEHLWFTGKNNGDSSINHTAESQSDCKDHQWFQNEGKEEIYFVIFLFSKESVDL